MAIKEAAHLCFLEQGYAGTSIGSITQAAGVAHGTFYVHFASKDAVLDELLVDFNEGLRTRLQPVLATWSSLPETVRRVAGIFLDYWEERRGFVECFARRSAAEARRLPILATLEASTSAGVDPKIMGIGPVPAVRSLLEEAGLGMDDLDLVELNEAFAVQVLAVDRDLGLPRDRLNVNGGAIALGHPIGATGARILVTLLHEMERRSSRRGMATLCVSGGMGMAVTVVR